MSLTRKLSLATLVLVLGGGLAACDKKEPTPAESLGEDVGAAQQRIEQGWDDTKKSTNDVLNNASDQLDATGNRIEAEAREAQSDFKRGQEAGKQQ